MVKMYPRIAWLCVVLILLLPLAVSAQSISQLTNGGFEEEWTGWTVSGLAGSVELLSILDGLEQTPKTGDSFLRFGYPETVESVFVSSITQIITNPPADPVLSFYHWLDGGDSAGLDMGQVLVNDEQVYQIDIGSGHTYGWVKVRIPLNSLPGNPLTLKFEASFDDNLPSNWFIDEINLFSSTNQLFLPFTSH